MLALTRRWLRRRATARHQRRGRWVCRGVLVILPPREV